METRETTEATPRDDETRRELQRVLVLCTGNSCRSQMAEAFLQERGSDVVEAQSAGSQPTGFVHPLAVEVLAEVGIDISRQRSKSIDEVRETPHDVVVTVCDAAERSCPTFGSAVKRLHWSFPDPAEARGDRAAVRAKFVDVRDAIARQVDVYLAELRGAS